MEEGETCELDCGFELGLLLTVGFLDDVGLELDGFFFFEEDELTVFLGFKLYLEFVKL